MKLTLTVTHDVLKEKGALTLDELFQEVKKIKQKDWTTEFSLSEDKVDDMKKGEIYVYLTTDGRFVKNIDSKWDLATNYSFKEVKKMKNNIGEI